MPSTLAEYEAYAHAHPTPHQGGTWAWPGGSLCEQLVNNAGNFSETFPSAQAAANASGPLDTDPNTIRPGHFGYFYDGGAGHVLLQTAHGVLMASHFVNSIGVGIGYLGSIAEYEQDYAAANGHHIKFLGHTIRHGSETLAGLTAASTSSSALDNSTGRLIQMGVLSLHPVTNATQAGFPWLVFNEITCSYILEDQNGHDNWVAAGVTEGPAMSTGQADQLDSRRAVLWPAKVLPGFNASVSVAPSPTPAPAPVDLTPLEDRLTAIEATLTKGYTFAVKPS